jgi:hypothetical protein
MSVQTQEPALTPTAPRRFHWGWPELGWLTFLTLGALTVWSIFRAQFWLWQYIILALWYVGLLWFGLKWPHFRSLTLSVLAIAGIGVGLYGAGLNPHNSLILRYGFQSNAMFVWMSVAIALSAMGYYGYLFRGARLAGIWGQRFAWVASTLGFAGLAIRWRETYLGHPSWGHIPVSNIYDVMVLFCAMTIHKEEEK